jgi:nucleotide-binding universal stress UspA family protein
MILMFKKILVPIDGSKPSYDALLRALKLAKIHGSEVEILHVTTFSEDLPAETSMTKAEPNSPAKWIDDYITKIRKNDENMLNNALMYSRTIVPAVKITTKLLIGLPENEIIMEAERGGFDLIVIGSRGLGGIKELVLGSVSHKVVNDSKIPVLVVK